MNPSEITDTNIIILKCQNCDKKYKSQIALNKHKLLCCDKEGNPFPIENKLQREGLTMTEAIEICKEPSMLMQSVEALIKSNNKLRMEVEELKKCNKQNQNKRDRNCRTKKYRGKLD